MVKASISFAFLLTLFALSCAMPVPPADEDGAHALQKRFYGGVMGGVYGGVMGGGWGGGCVVATMCGMGGMSMMGMMGGIHPALLSQYYAMMMYNPWAYSMGWF